MKSLILIASFALWAGVATAQLDQILAPVQASIAVAPQTPANPAAADAQAAAPAAADPSAISHRNLTGDDLLNELQKQLASYF